MSNEVLFALRREFLASFGAAVAACGKVEGPASPDAIVPVLPGLIYTDYPIRHLGPFNVGLSPDVDEPFARRMFGIVEEMTSGDVFFTFDSDRPVTLEIAGLIPNDPDIIHPGGQYGAVTRLNLRGHYISSARIVFCCPHTFTSPACYLHEIGHAIGFGHIAETAPEFHQCLMGSAPLHQDWFHPLERAGWRQLAGMTLPQSTQGVVRMEAC